MPRSSRYRSHRGHRHDRDRSGSPSSADEPDSSKKRKVTAAVSPSSRAGPEGANAATVDPDSSADQGGRKRKDRDSSRSTATTVEAAADSAAAGPDRWNGDVGTDAHGGLIEDKRVNVEESVVVAPPPPDSDKGAKGKVPGSESRNRPASGNRHCAADGGKDESGGCGTRNESARRRADKESSSRRETTDRDRDRDHRAPDKDHGHDKDKGTRHASVVADAHGKDKERAQPPEPYDKSKRSKERTSNAAVATANTDADVHADRDTGRKVQDHHLCSSDTERRLKKQVVKDGSGDKRRPKGDGTGSEDRANDLNRNGAYRDTEKQTRYRDKSTEDADRNRRSRDDRYQKDRPSRDESHERSEHRYQKDTNKRPENHRRQDKDRESTPSTRDHSMKSMDVRLRKRPFNDKEEEPNNSEFPTVVERNTLDLDYNSEDKGRPESVHSNRVDSNSRHKQSTRSPNSALHILQDEYRALSKERNRTSSASSGDRASISGSAEKALDSYSVESHAKLKGTPLSADYTLEDGLPPRSDSHPSANQMAEESPTSPPYNTDRKGNISRVSPSNIFPPSMRHGSGSTSVQGSAEYDDRTQSGDYRSVNRYKRNGDSRMSRAQGGAWNGVPNWPPPVPNGFMPFPHGPPGPFHHHVGQQYPAPPMFGVRPLMDFNHASVSFRIHEAPPDRFPGRPFGWRNPSGHSAPQFQGWEGNDVVFGNDAHMFGRGEPVHGRHSNNQGSETSGGIKGRGEKAPMGLDSNNNHPDFSPQARTDETHTAELEDKSNRHLPEHVGMGQKAKPVAATDMKIKAEPALKPSDIDNGPGFLGQLLSKLDISVNLTSPELYMRINLNQNGDGKTIDSRGLKHINGQVGKKFNLGIKGLSRGSRPWLPAVADDIFKKAVSLYKSSGEERVGMKFPQNTSVDKNNKILSTSSGENKTSADVPSAEKDADTRTADACELPGSSLQAMDVDKADVKEQEHANIADVSNVSHSSGQLSSSYPGKQASGGEFVEKCAKECVGLIPEFVSRIHSPGSSH